MPRATPTEAGETISEPQTERPTRLFIRHCAIEPEHRDENLKHLRDVMIGEPTDVKVMGSWLSVTQRESWVIFDAPDAASVAKLFHQWTDLNVNHVTPVMAVPDMLDVIAEAE